MNPNGVYAQSKAAGEEVVRNRLERHLIIRVSWLVGRYGNNFVKTILRLGKTREEIRVVDDQVGSPTFAAVGHELSSVCGDVASLVSPAVCFHLTIRGSSPGASTMAAAVPRSSLSARRFAPLCKGTLVPAMSALSPSARRCPLRYSS